MKHTSRKKMLVSSVAMLLVAMLALGSATYAWFSTKTTAHAEALTANTTQGTNLMISEQKTTGWTQDLTFTNATTTKLDPVTPKDAALTTWQAGTADGWDTQVIGTDGLGDVNKNGYVLEQVVYVKYAADSGSFNLNVDLGITVNAGTDDYYRVAIVPVAKATDGDLTDASGATTKIYADAANYNASHTPVYTSDTATEDIALGTITAGNVYGYKVVIWFEGHDLDCKDTLSTNNVTLELDFGGTAA